MSAVHIMPYNPAWPALFEEEALKIREILGKNCCEIHHIGSTAVPGLKAKEDIDVLCIVKYLAETSSLENDGYIFKGEINIPGRYFFSNNTEGKVNLHVVEEGHAFSNCVLAFRDYLRADKMACKAYVALKEKILKDPQSHGKVRGIFKSYTLEKNVFIKKLS